MFDDLRPGPRLGSKKARKGGKQRRPLPTASELFEILDAEARVTVGPSTEQGVDDEPLPSLEEGGDADVAAGVEPWCRQQ